MGEQWYSGHSLRQCNCLTYSPARPKALKKFNISGFLRLWLWTTLVSQ
jgi:hypothetical protein